MKDAQLIEQAIGIIGKVRLQVIDRKTGMVKHDTGFQKNLVTTLGKAAIAGLIGNTGAITAFTYLALGTGFAAVTIADLTLGAEIVDTALTRQVATVSRTTTTGANDTLNFVYTWSPNGPKTIQEIGIFNASSAGTMLARKLTGAILVSSTDQLVATYTVQIT